MFGKRLRSSPAQRIVLVRLPGMEQLVSAISDLTTAVNALVAVEQQVVDLLHNQPQPPAGTVLSPEDQAALDAAVSTVQSVAATLTDALPTGPAPAPTVVDGGATSEPPASPNV